jgi:hypothetical protein
MVAQCAWPVPKQCPEQRLRRYKQFKFLHQVRGGLQKVVPFIQRFFQKRVAFDWVTLKEAHLLEVTDSAVSHFGRFA